MTHSELLKTIEAYSESGSGILLRQIEDYCSEHELFFAEDEEFITIEDDIFYLNF